MSKSLDNIIDPLDTIKDYGADATRLSLLIGSTPGNDSNISVAKISGYRNFVNKLWNISRYVLTQVENPRIVNERPEPITLADEWILSELDELVSFATKNIEQYNLSIVGERIYEFTWSKLADWYLEIAKVEKNKDEILLYVLQNLLKLWHPFTPFITENIWSMFNSGSLLMIADWPKVNKNKNSNVDKFNLIKEVITAIRVARSEAVVAPALKIPALLITKKDQKLLEEQKEIISALARLSDLEIKESAEKPEQSIFTVVGGVEIYLSLSGTIDIDKQKAKLEKEIEELSRYIIAQKQKLDNQQFVKNAPKNIIDAEKSKLAEAENKSAALQAQLSLL